MTNAVIQKEAHRLPSHSNVIHKMHVVWRGGRVGYTRVETEGQRCRCILAHGHLSIEANNAVFISIYTHAHICKYKYTDTIGIIRHSQSSDEKHSIFRSQQAGRREQLLISVLVKITIPDCQLFSLLHHVYTSQHPLYGFYISLMAWVDGLSAFRVFYLHICILNYSQKDVYLI